MRIVVDTYIQKFLSLFGLVIGIEYDTKDKHLVAIFIKKESVFKK